MLLHFDNHHHLLPPVTFALSLTPIECGSPQITIPAPQMEDYKLRSKCGNSRILEMNTYEAQSHHQIMKEDVYTSAVHAGQ